MGDAGYWVFRQTNALSVQPKGVAEAIFDTDPYSNIYRDGTNRYIRLGSAFITGNVVALHAQRNPGKPNAGDDSEVARIEWLKSA